MQILNMVVLDMAGTTINEDNMVYKTVQHVINQQGFAVTLADVLQHGAGKEKHKAIQDVLTACTDLNADEVLEIAAEAFAEFKPELETAYENSLIEPYEGMEDFFASLKKTGVKVVLNTGYDSKTANKLLQKVNWKVGEQIDALITSDDVEKGRPHPDMILKAMAQFGITDAATVLKAGDSEIDIIEGKNARCGFTVGVLSGAQTKEQLAVAEPDYILDNACLIYPLLFPVDDLKKQIVS